MNGGAYEDVAGYVNNGHSNLTTYGSTLVNTAGKYKDVYSKGSRDSNTLNYEMSTPDRGHYGDAVWETSSQGNVGNSWYGDYSDFPYNNGAFFCRGGGIASTNFNGIFYFCYSEGYYYSSGYGFRVVVPVF